VIGLLDCGMIGRIDDYTREEIEGMLLAAVERDAEQLTESVIRLGSTPQGLDRNAMRADIDEFLSEYIGQSLQDFDLSGAVEGLTDIIRQHHILLPPGVASLLKVLVMLEGTSRLLNRDFSLIDLMKPYYAKAIQRRLSPQKFLQRLQRSYRDWERFLNVLPHELTDMLHRIRDGKFDVHVEHRKLDTTVNRLVYGILTAALFLGSCQLVSQAIPPLIRGISVFGIAGLIGSFILGFRVLRAIKKSGDLYHE
jgi:ubiquinone biosynthesis protein